MPTPVRDTAVADWDSKDHLFGKILRDRRGGRRHAYAGATKHAAIIDGALDLPGSGGVGYALTPDAAPLDITGDIDLRALIAPVSWTPAINQNIVTKFANTAGTVSYFLNHRSDGKLELGWGATSSNTITSIISDVAVPGTAPKTPLWVRATLDVDNGAGGRTATFYTSSDGIVWTVFSTVTVAGTTVIYAGSAALMVGGWNGVLTVFHGRIFKAEVRNGINGTIVASPDFTGKPNGTPGFADAQGNVWSVNGNPGQIIDGAYRSPGTAGSYLATGHRPEFNISADLDLRADVALNDWTPLAAASLVGKMLSATSRSYGLDVWTDGTLQLRYSLDGSTALFVRSTIAVPASAGGRMQVRATRVSATGAVEFFYRASGASTWTALGVSVAGTAGALAATTGLVEVGATFAGSTQNLSGAVYGAEIRSGINGTVVLNLDFADVPDQQMWADDAQGRRWRLIQPAGTTNDPKLLADEDESYHYDPGAGNNFTIPDHPDFTFGVGMDLRIKVAFDGMSTLQHLIGQWSSTSGNLGWMFFLTAAGALSFAGTSDGGVQVYTTFPTITNTWLVPGQAAWLRFHWVNTAGFGIQALISYDYDPDTNTGTWTTIGATIRSDPSIFNSSLPLELLGSVGGTVSPFSGRFYRAQAWNTAGVKVLDVKQEDFGHGVLYRADPSTPNLLDRRASLDAVNTPAGSGWGAITNATVAVGTDGTDPVLQVTAPGAGNAVFWHAANGQYIPIVPGQEVSGRVKVKFPAGVGTEDVIIQARFLDVDGNPLSDSNISTSDLAPNTWVDCLAWGIAPANAAYVVLRPHLYGMTAGQVARVKHAQISYGAQQAWQAGEKPTWIARPMTNARKATVVDAGKQAFLFGADRYFAVVDDAALDVDVGEHLTASIAARQYNVNASTTQIAKRAGAAAGNVGWHLAIHDAGYVQAATGDGTTARNAGFTSGTIKPGVAHVATFRLDRAVQQKAYLNGVSGGAPASSPSATLANAEELRIGRFSGAGTSYAAFDFFGAAIWKAAKWDSEILALNEEFFPLPGRTIGVLHNGVYVEKPIFRRGASGEAIPIPV